jgi:hypothetical protein
MKQISIIILGVFLVVAFTLSGCAKTEYVTVTDTTTLPAVMVTQTATTTITTTSERSYSYKLIDALLLYIIDVVQSRGLLDEVAGIGNRGDCIHLLFDKQINDEVVSLAQESIDTIAPGFPLEVMVGTIVTKIV